MRADQALEVARRYRRDWMNTRADARRSLAAASSSTPTSSRPGSTCSSAATSATSATTRSASAAEHGPLRVGVQFDAPITRLPERNHYRQSLIEYQQARRSYYNFEDGIARGLRAQLRQLTTFQINFELQAAGRDRSRPPGHAQYVHRPGSAAHGDHPRHGRPRRRAGPHRPAQRPEQLHEHLDQLRSAAPAASTFDLGTMQLDNEGLWIDPGKIGPDYGQYDPWLWRDTPGFAGHELMKHGEGQMEDPDKGLDQLPPPFTVAAGGQENVPPPPRNRLVAPPVRCRSARERGVATR